MRLNQNVIKVGSLIGRIGKHENVGVTLLLRTITHLLSNYTEVRLKRVDRAG